MALALLEIQPELKKLPRKLRSFCLAYDISWLLVLELNRPLLSTSKVSWYAELRLLFVLGGVDCAFVRWLEVCVPPQDDVLSVYGCTYLKDVDDGADDKGYYVVKLESIKACGSGAGRQCLAFTPARVTDRPYNLPALNANSPSAVQPSGLSQSDVSEHPSNSPNQDARGSVDEMPRPEVQGAQFNQPRPAIPGQFTGKAKKAAAPPKASAKERHSQPPPIEDDGSGVGEKGK
eukprot:gene3402-13446_t